ncbi:hypothetical protein HPB50_014105 [Hyalomma asiaticum]|uniref:Uncharacterized protein n=1 Tax=Hyalomma asiaticum TaxID=266040 RepID=A0ACB7T7W6_HYAAI|nr:hypothetical protein HPB50_014105 [Hyalomma asiaticum]
MQVFTKAVILMVLPAPDGIVPPRMPSTCTSRSHANDIRAALATDFKEALINDSTEQAVPDPPSLILGSSWEAPLASTAVVTAAMNAPHLLTTLVFHVGISELELYGHDESLRRLRRLVNNTLRARPELQRLIISCVLPRAPNHHLERPNLKFVHRFNWEARQFNETIKTYCRRPSKVSCVDYHFDQLPPQRFLAADGLHPSFTGVALLAEMLKNTLSRGVIQAAPGWSSHPTAQESLHTTGAAASPQIPATVKPCGVEDEYPTIVESLAPRHSTQPPAIERSTTPLTNVKSTARQQSPASPARTPRPEHPGDADVKHPTPTKSVATQRRRPTGHTYNLRTPAVPSSPHAKED